MNQGRKNSSYESSSQIAFWCMVATMLLVVLLLLFPQVAEPQNVEWRKPDISSQEHFLAGTMISYTSGYLLEQGLNMRYGYEIGLIAGGVAGYLKERSDPVFDMTDLSFTVAGSITGLLINRGIEKYYGLSDYEKVLKKIKRLEKKVEKMKHKQRSKT
jgi:glycopeptide antibiotics resistance protein